MILIARTTAKLWLVALAFVLFVAPVSAQSVVFTANPPAGDNGNPCSFASPCQTLNTAIDGTSLASGGQVTCAQGTAFGGTFPATQSVTVDCPGLFVPTQTGMGLQGNGTVIKVRNLTFNGQFAGNGSDGASITVGSGSALIFENCVFENFSGTAIQIAANGSYTLILRNVRMVNNGAGVVLKPASGGSIKATLDHVTISLNNGGGIKVDTTNGPVTLDITESTISNNGGNGMNAVGGAGGPAMFNIHNSVIAKNGAGGVQVNGATAAAMIDTTLLDSNTAGATAVVNGGHILTYGNNRIVGSAGSGFTGTAPLN
jgi:Right handed beta helix region